MNRDSIILILGATGLVGSALARTLTAAGYTHVLAPNRSELALQDGSAVAAFMARTNPEIVFLAAARVGGIMANTTYPAEFLFQNLSIETNVIQASFTSGVRRLLFLGSSCIYPKHAPQPIAESELLTGPLEPSNRSFAIAKIAGVEMCWAMNRQYGTRYLVPMPGNLYGPGDHYDLSNSHVLPALLRKAHEAKARGDSEMVVWGTGTPRREFLYSEDLAAACIRLAQLSDHEFDTHIKSEDEPPTVNVGPGDDVSIAELASIISDVVGYTGALSFDRSKPDGTPRKLLSVSRISSLGWRPAVSLREGIARTYGDFLQRFHQQQQELACV